MYVDFLELQSCGHLAKKLQKAHRLLEGEVIYTDSRPPQKISFWSSFKLWRAERLLADVIEEAPENWPAWFFTGKIFQRRQNHREALASFALGYEKAGSNPLAAYLAIEASISAAHIGFGEKAEEFGWKAYEIAPDDIGIRSDLALALLVNDKMNEASALIDIVVAEAADDQIAANLKKIIDYIIFHGIKPPKSLPELYVTGLPIREK